MPMLGHYPHSVTLWRSPTVNFSASGFGRTDCGWGMSTHGETTPNLTLWVTFPYSSKILPASPSLCLVSADYLWSDLYVFVLSYMFVCVWLVWEIKATPISSLKTNVLYLFIPHLQSSGHVVTGYNSKLDSSFLRRAPACIIIHSDCMSASGFGRTDCGWGMSTHGETTPNLTLWVTFLYSSKILPASPSLCLYYSPHSEIRCS